MRALVDRLISMTAPRDEYRLERASIASVDDGLRWMRDWHGVDGRYTWMNGDGGDEERRRTVKHWQWLKWQHRTAIETRGGQDDD